MNDIEQKQHKTALTKLEQAMLVAMEAEEKVRGMGLTEDQAEMAAFEMNAKDAARLGGN